MFNNTNYEIAMEIENVYLLMEAVIRQANIDANRDHHTTTDLPRTCDATEKEHPARNCALNLLDLIHMHEDDLIELCFEVTRLWLQ